MKCILFEQFDELLSLVYFAYCNSYTGGVPRGFRDKQFLKIRFNMQMGFDHIEDHMQHNATLITGVLLLIKNLQRLRYDSLLEFIFIFVEF